MIPDEADRRVVQDIIYDELCRGEVRRESRARCLKIVGRMRADGAEGVILGCTEIGLLIGKDDLDIPVVDSLEAHVGSAWRRRWVPVTHRKRVCPRGRTVHRIERTGRLTLTR